LEKLISSIPSPGLKIVAHEIGLGVTSTAALMHDVVEDAVKLVKEIEKMSSKNRTINEGLTKIAQVKQNGGSMQKRKISEKCS
jgi:(p)ppGpp synthase/HD superfamily hydrolase